MHISRIIMAVVASMSLTLACKEGSTAIDRPASDGLGATSYSLGPGATICGQIVSLGQIPADGQGTQSLVFQIAACGFVSPDDSATEWKALGATFEASQLKLWRSGSGDDSAHATIAMNASGELSAIAADGTAVAFAKASTRGEGEPVTLNDGVTFELIGDGKGFEIDKMPEWNAASERYVRLRLP